MLYNNEHEWARDARRVVSTFELNREGCAAGCGVSTFELNREGSAAGSVSTYELIRVGCATGRVVLNTIQWGSNQRGSTVFKTAGFTLKLFTFVHLFRGTLSQKATFTPKTQLWSGFHDLEIWKFVIKLRLFCYRVTSYVVVVYSSNSFKHISFSFVCLVW
jgi:hypothetical protein